MSTDTVGISSRSAAEERLRDAYARRDAVLNRRRYSVFDPGCLFLVQSRERALLRMLGHNGYRSFDGLKILDVGCGAGAMLRTFNQYGAPTQNLIGVDLLPDRIESARLLSPGIEFHCTNAERLPFQDESFDIVSQFVLFDTILESTVRQAVAREMVRVVRKDGVIIWYDFRVNNLRNSDARAVGRREIRRLFPECQLHLKRATLAPPLARLLAPHMWLLAAALERIPALCTHYIGIVRKG